MKAALEAVGESRGLKLGKTQAPIRVAVTGRSGDDDINARLPDPVTVDGDTAHVVTADTGNIAWSTDTLTPPPAAIPGSARFVATAGNAVVVAWTIPTRPEPIQAVYRLSDAEIRWISGSRSPMVVTADSSSGATMITTQTSPTTESLSCSSSTAPEVSPPINFPVPTASLWSAASSTARRTRG